MGYWLYLWQLGTKVELAIEAGRIVASTATQDIGTGTRSVIADAVAREFGLDPHEVEVRIGEFEAPGGADIRRQPRHRVDRAAARSSPPASSRPRHRRQDGTQACPGSNAPWRDLIAASPDLKVVGRAP